MFLFFLFNYLCQADIFVLITDTNKINSLTLFDSNSTSIIPYATLPGRFHVFAHCPHHSNDIYFASFANSTVYFNKINKQTGNTLQKIELFVTHIVLNEKGHVFGITVQSGEHLISQIVNNTVITKYIFPQNFSSIIPQINYFPKFQSFIVSYLSRPNDTNAISVIRQWKSYNLFHFHMPFQFVIYCYGMIRVCIF